MAPSKGRTRNRSVKKRIKKRIPRRGVRSGVKPSDRKRANTPYQRRRGYDSISIPQLVYELLTVDKYNRDTRRSLERLKTPPQRMRGYREQQGLSFGVVDRYNNSESIRVPEYMVESKPTSVESLTEVTDAANSSVPTSSANSSVSNVSMEPIMLANSLNSARALFKKKSLVQLVNSYIKAGIEEGKRQAKKYIRKALSFGVRSGYLTPADARGNVLHVCPTLVSSRTSDAESRRNRRIARRGKTHLTTIDDRKAMRRGIPARSGTSRRDVRAENTATSGRRRYKKHPTASPARSLSAKNDSLRKSSNQSRLHEKNKSRSSGARSKIDERANNKREQQRKQSDNRDLEKPIKQRRTALSPRRTGNHHETVVESYANASDRDRDRYKSNEDNYKIVASRRRPSRESESRVEGQKTGMNIDEDRDIEPKNDDDDDNDDEKSEEASVERDVKNGTAGDV